MHGIAEKNSLQSRACETAVLRNSRIDQNRIFNFRSDVLGANLRACSAPRQKTRGIIHVVIIGVFSAEPLNSSQLIEIITGSPVVSEKLA